MVRLLLLRLILAAAPFAVWWLWTLHARRQERPVGVTPWGWLVAAAGLLVALSLLAPVAFSEDNRGDTYVPAQANPDGSVAGGRFTRPSS
jgi:hypothetical protein